NRFPYDGSNLSILTIKGNQQWTSANPSWRHTTASPARARQSSNDNSQPVSLTASTNLPNLKLKIFPAVGMLYPPQNLSATPGNGYVNLAWEAPLSGTPTGYRIYRNGSLLTTVAGLTHTDNNVVNETTYSYYVTAVYSGGDSDPSNTVQVMPTGIVPSEVIIGTGTSSNSTSTACPINVYYQSLHGQSVYTKAELNTAGVVGPVYITELGFNITGLPAKAMPSFVVRMGHTTATDVSSWIDTGLTQVWSSASYQPTEIGWNMYTLTTPFLWNGTDNIVIDTAFRQIGSYSSSGTTQYTSVSNGYRFVRLDSADQTNVFSGGSTSSYRPNLKLKLVSAHETLYPPQNLSASPGNGYVNLAWEAPLSGTPTSYRIYRNGSLLTSVTALTYTDNNVVNETTYSYYVCAVYSDGVSDPSNTVQATPTAVVLTEVILGDGTSSNSNYDACPINVWYKSLHGQSVYTKAELNAAGVTGPINITQIGFNITGLPGYAMPNFVVRMGHTAATDVSSWIPGGLLTQVWSSASYLPTEIGWNMYTLSTPFLWNGVDNIVVDTAFSPTTGYSSTGTTQYTAVTNGYRFTRQDSPDQTNVFSGGEVNNLRPNLKLILQPNAGGPMIAVSPNTLNYGEVAVGGTEVKTLTILNGGDETLTGTITTPAGYTVAEAGRSTRSMQFAKESRNSLAFSVSAGASKTYNLTFTPTAVTAYNGNVVIANNSNNDPNASIAVSGMGYIPPTISIDGNALYANLRVGTQGTDSFIITNSGSKPLSFNITMEELASRANKGLQLASGQDKSIAGSTLTLDTTDYLPGTTVDWTFTVTNGSTGYEWLKDVIITFPTGVTVNSTTNFVGGSNGDLTPDVNSGNGVTITWHGETSYGYGMIKAGESASATVNVTIGSSLGGNLSLPWTINGDIHGEDPHTLSDSITLAQDLPPVPWLSVQPLSGSIAAGESQTITANFSAVGMAVGSYAALLSIYSNDPVNPSLNVNASMDVWDNASPQIALPASFEFDRNGSLTVNFSSYVSDPELDPLTLGYSGNTNILVDISGMNVTFTATQNWTGSETITFSVYDGHSYAYDSVVVTVNEVTRPDWTPVVYPNSATIHGIVSIYEVAAGLNDVVGAFVGTECRGTADVVTSGGNAYVTLVVNLASSGEVVSFKVFDYSANQSYDASQTYTLAYNDVIGSTASPAPISVIAITELNTPVITGITKISGGFRITWNAVENADVYEVWRATDPYGTFQKIGSNINALQYNDLTELPKAFYYIKAIKN
ncbi:MAG: fibronectin type III domain-containing protein, partial [Candidatus Cloacimonadaceae bacterium]